MKTPTEKTEPEDDQDEETEQSLSDSLQKRRQIATVHENLGCAACEAQKRPAGRSPSSFVFNDVVGLDLFFSNTYERHNLPAMNIMCWSTGLQRVVSHLEDRKKKTIGCDHTEDPCILVVDQQRSLCPGIFAEKVESDGTRLEVTLLEAPWKNGTTERASKNWKEDYCKVTQDGPEAETWTDFEEDCDAVNQARA